MPVDLAEKIDRKLHAVSQELVGANLYYQLFLDVTKSFSEYLDVVNNSPIFWGFTRDALFDSALLRLCRVYDKQEGSNGLPNVLKAIKEHPETFDEEHFRKRLPNIDYRDGLTANSRRPDPRELEEDIDFVSNKNAAVKKLMARRNNLLAHRSAKLVERQIPLGLKNNPTYGDLSGLLEGGLKIVNRYLGLFRATEQIAVFFSGNDHGFVFKAGRESLENRKKQLRAEAALYGIDIDI